MEWAVCGWATGNMSNGLVDVVDDVGGRSRLGFCGLLRLSPRVFEPDDVDEFRGVRDLVERKAASRGSCVGAGDRLLPSPNRTNASMARSRLPLTPLSTMAFRWPS